jgi:uncharacterized radical SAM superfamily protein
LKAVADQNAALTKYMYFAVPSAKKYHNEYFTNHPFRFVNISITGSSCSCHCEHCNASLLEGMIPVDGPENFRMITDKLLQKGCQGILVSGGADANGRVPLSPFLDAIHDAHQKGLDIVVHSGLLDRAMAQGLKEAGVSQVMIDIIGDEQTIQKVYHLNAKPEDYLQAMLNCSDVGLSIAPHIVIGLHFGTILGENRALQMIAAADPACLTLVVLTPMKGTGMVSVNPPPLFQVEEIMRTARNMFADLPITLGCARPAGLYKKALEKSAIDLALNGVAYPAESTINYALNKGLTPVFFEACCSLLGKHIVEG